MVSQVIAKYDEQERLIVRGLFFAVLMLGALYGYFLVSSIVDALLRTEYEKAAQRVESSVGSTEAAYMKEVATVDLARAEAAGFIPSPSPKFLSQGAPSGNLTFNR